MSRENDRALAAALDRIDAREAARREARAARLTTDVLGVNIRRARKAKGWTLRRLSDRCGVAFGYLHKIETGMCDNPGITRLLRIAQALDVSIIDLLTERDDGDLRG